jgi:hypothetical protein
MAIVLGVAAKTNLVSGDTPAVNAAYAGLYAPVVLTLLAGGASAWLGPVAGRAGETACGLGIAATGVLFAVASARSTCTLPTDAREQSWVLGWRPSVPRGAVVCWYGHAGQRMLDLPLYRGAEMPRAIRLEDGAAVSDGAYYVRTSLCSTDEGRAACEGFESSHRLVAVERRSLPAIASLPWLPFRVPAVEVVLYRLGE